MTLILKNQTAGTLSYLGGLVTVVGSGSTTVPSNYTFPLSKDSGLVYDCKNASVVINDGFTDYEGDQALTYLGQVATSIGGAVVGLVGATTPAYAILVGGVDGSNIVRPGSMDSSGALAVIGKGVAGTPAGGVLSIQGVSGMTPFASAGDVASGSADSGNPVKIGGVYNSSLPAVASGNRNDMQLNALAELVVQFRNKYSNITGNATTTVKSGAGRLHGISINNNGSSGTVTVYDNTSGSGTKIGTFAVGSPSGGLLSTSGVPGPIFIGPLGAEFSTGLTIVTSGSSSNNITIYYQ